MQIQFTDNSVVALFFIFIFWGGVTMYGMYIQYAQSRRNPDCFTLTSRFCCLWQDAACM